MPYLIFESIICMVTDLRIICTAMDLRVTNMHFNDIFNLYGYRFMHNTYGAVKAEANVPFRLSDDPHLSRPKIAK